MEDASTEGKIIKMIPFKDGRIMFINTDDIDYTNNTMSFYLTNDSPKPEYLSKIQFQIDSSKGIDVIIPLNEEGKSMFGLPKDMLYEKPSSEIDEMEAALLYVRNEIFHIMNKCKNKDDFKELINFFENYFLE